MDFGRRLALHLDRGRRCGADDRVFLSARSDTGEEQVERGDDFVAKVHHVPDHMPEGSFRHSRKLADKHNVFPLTNGHQRLKP
jgi:hypothetical protein